MVTELPQWDYCLYFCFVLNFCVLFFPALLEIMDNVMIFWRKRDRAGTWEVFG